MISFRKNSQKQCEGEIADTQAKVSRRAECIARQKKAEAERKEDHERLQKVRSRLEVLQSDRKRWKEQEEKLLENLEEAEMEEFLQELITPRLHRMFVTPKDVDETVKRLSYTISEGINIAMEA